MKTRWSMACLAPMAALALAALNAAEAQEWTRFRGPNGSGVSSSTSIPTRWTDQDLNWKVKLAGMGHSSPVLWGKRIFVTSGDNKTGTRFVQCLRADDGKTLWQKEYAGAVSGKHADNSYASSTPAVDLRQLYVTWGNAKEYLVIALSHEGKESWRVDLGPFRAGHGFGASPIVHDDLLIVPNDQDAKSSVLALDKKTGQVRWQTQRKSRSSYGTPCIFQPNGKAAELILVSYEHGISGLDPKSGRVNWEADVFSKGHVEATIASPITSGDLVFGTSGWLGVKYETVAYRPAANGTKAQVTYQIDKVAPLVPTPLVKDDLLFLWNDRGVVACAAVQSAEIHWRERVAGSFYGSPVCAGNHLYAISREGEVVVLSASKKFQLVARNPLPEGSHSTPAIADNTLYVRTFFHLLAVGGRPAK